jgi:hypothetical protein
MSKFDGSFNNDDSSLLNDPLKVSHISAENLKIPLYLHVFNYYSRGMRYNL